jgi:hypothetical protein
MKFKAGDPVWALDVRQTGKEYPAVIIDHLPLISIIVSGCCGEVYTVEGEAIPVPQGYKGNAFCVCCLRPRRDDPQQREGLGTRAEVFVPSPLPDDPLPTNVNPITESEPEEVY